MHDDAFRLFPGFKKPVEILLLMKRIATRPVDHSNVGVGQHFSIEIVFGTGIEQHIHDTGDGI